MKPSDSDAIVANLPVLWVPPQSFARAVPRGPEVVRYAARPGLGALPEGGGALIGFGLLQAFPLVVLLWALWWPWPSTPARMAVTSAVTAAIGLLEVGVFVLLMRHRTASAVALLVVPFTRLTVTDRRVLWTLPWRRQPLFELESGRVRGGLLGPADLRGTGAAAILLVPGDPAGDADDLIHFDRLPDAAGFVEALRTLA